MRLVKRRFQMNSRWVAWLASPRPRRAFRFTLYSTLCVVSRAPRVRRERWLQVLDGRRRHRGIRTCSTRRPRRPQFRRGAFVMSGGNSQEESSHRERAAYLPRRRAVGARGSSVGGSAERRWRRRHLLREAAASDRPPTVRPASVEACLVRTAKSPASLCRFAP